MIKIIDQKRRIYPKRELGIKVFEIVNIFGEECHFLSQLSNININRGRVLTANSPKTLTRVAKQPVDATEKLQHTVICSVRRSRFSPASQVALPRFLRRPV